MEVVEAFKDIPFADVTVKVVVARGGAGAVKAAAVRSKERRKDKQSEADIRRRLEEAFAFHHPAEHGRPTPGEHRRSR